MARKKNKKQETIGRISALIIIVISLLVSFFFSMASLTGHVISENTNISTNILAVMFFLSGIAGASFFMSRKK